MNRERIRTPVATVAGCMLASVALVGCDGSEIDDAVDEFDSEMDDAVAGDAPDVALEAVEDVASRTAG